MSAPKPKAKQPPLLQAKLIGGVIARGASKTLIEQLPTQGVIASEYVSIRAVQSNMQSDTWQEMDLLRLVVAPEHAESLFEQVFVMAEIASIEGSYLYQHDLPKSTAYQLPQLPEEGVSVAALKNSEAAQDLGLTREEQAQLQVLAQYE